MNILLVEPDYILKYHNLGLLKLATKYKKLRYNVHYVKGIENKLFFKPDTICISTMFTYYSKQTFECIEYYKRNYPEANIIVGGIFASLMPELIKEKTGVNDVRVGCFEELDCLPGDKDTMKEMETFTPYLKKWNDFSFLFTTRGCPNKCSFCAVKTLEPETKIISNWRELIDYNKNNIMLFDNNLTALPFSHFKDVCEHLIKIKKIIFFHNGFDVRLMNEEHMKLLCKIKWYPGGLRVAFDNMSQDGHFQKKVSRLIELGIPKSAFLVFTLFNFKDTVEEAMYRCNESKKLGIRPYPCWYRELNSLDKKITSIGEHWNIDLIRKFHSYWYLAGNYKYKTFEEFLNENNKKTKQVLEYMELF